MSEDAVLRRRRQIYAGRAVDLSVDSVVLPNGIECDLEMVRHPGGAAVVALDDRGCVCVLHQYRHAAGGWIWEIPAGRLDPHEPPAHTARRELAEEAGVAASNWYGLGTMLSSPGVFTEIVHLYFARSLVEVGASADEDEVFETDWVPLDDALARAVAGDINDAKSVIALFRARALLDASPATLDAARIAF